MKDLADADDRRSRLSARQGWDLSTLLAYLPPKERRLVLGAAARSRGPDGIPAVVAATGMSTSTVARGVADLSAPRAGQVSRRPGGGRQRSECVDPGLTETFAELLNESKGVVLEWAPSTRSLAHRLQERGHVVSDRVVARLLDEMGYELAAAAAVAGRPRRDEAGQGFGAVDDLAVTYLSAGHPVFVVAASHRAAACPHPGRQDWTVTPPDLTTGSLAAAAIARWATAALPAPRDGHLRVLTCVNWSVRDCSPQFWTNWQQLLDVASAAIGVPIDICPVPAGTVRWPTAIETRTERVVKADRDRTNCHEITISQITAPGTDAVQRKRRTGRAAGVGEATRRV